MRKVAAGLLAFAAAGCSAPTSVPPHAFAAAQRLIPGLQISEAESERDGGKVRYAFEGTIPEGEVELEFGEDVASGIGSSRK